MAPKTISDLLELVYLLTKTKIVHENQLMHKIATQMFPHYVISEPAI